MAVKDFKFNLDIEKEDYIPLFKVKQYDTAIFYVNLLKNGTPFPITNETIKIFAKKSDGKLIYQEDEISIENGLIKINVKNQAFTSPGLAYAELELKSNTGQVTTATFIYEVREKVGSDKAVESVTDISTLEKIDKYVEEAKKELDKFKNDLSKLEDLVANKDKLEGQNTEAKVNISELEKVLDQANNIVSDEGKKVVGNNVFSDGVTNGYVQNIKLTGKTLVNLVKIKDQFLGSGNTAYATITAINNLEIGKIYTYIPLNVPGFIQGMYLGDSSSTNVLVRYTTDIKPTTFNITSSIDLNTMIPHFYGANNTELTVAQRNELTQKTKIMILEGDCTQNPPNYFEGMKSVGDGVDEIIVSSVKIDGNLFDINNLEDGTILPLTGEDYDSSTKFRTDFIRIPKGSSVCVQNLASDNYIYYYSENKSFISSRISTSPQTPTNASYIRIIINRTEDLDSIVINKGTTPISYMPYKCDKKKLLYLDTTDNTWKKPVLRECDSIKKHGDGKYYYHKRGKGILWNGTEQWVKNNDLTLNSCWYTRVPDVKFNSSLICDKLYKGVAGQSDFPCIGSASYSSLYLTIPRNTTPSDYLRTNNLELIYELKQEEIYECLDISVRAFRNETMLSVNSGPIDPGVEYYLPTGFVSADNSLSSKLENVDSELINLMFDYLGHNHDSRYFTKSESDQRYPLIYASDVTDFNTCLTEGVHSVGSSSDLPNAPYIDAGMGIYGTLEVLKKKNEYIQRFTSNICKMFVRFRNYAGVWSPWNRAISDKDFNECKNDRDNGYQVLPSGIIIQWGSTVLPFVDHRVHGYLPYPIAYKEYVHCCGNVSANDYGGFCEATGSVAGDDLTRGYAEAQDVTGSNRNGKNVRFQWISIGK
ncbi:MAG: BppU family phage baseplate upper protein [Peptostreptococcaceae bacterium]